MTIHWKALDEHVLIMPFVARLKIILAKNIHFLKPQSFKGYQMTSAA
jgi:hypothetical protein